MSLLRALDLTKSYDRRQVVKRMNVEVRSGETIGLLGRNGAGKTTMFQMMVGLLRPDSGKILLDDEDISRCPTYERAARGITYLPQEGSVFLKASVEDNLRMVLELKPYSAGERQTLAANLLAELGLAELAKQSAHSLSGGERRRLEICRALSLKPKFLLLDEPFTGIDPLTIIELQRILLKLRDKGIGIVISDHNVRDTFRIASRAYVIDNGKLLIEGSPQQIAADDRARERFLGRSFKLGEEIPS